MTFSPSVAAPAQPAWSAIAFGRRLPLQLRLILLVLACTIPLLGLGLAREYWGYRQTVDKTGEEKLQLARSLAISVDGALQRYITALEMLAETKRLREGDLDGFRKLADEVVRERFPGANLLLLREDGRMLMHTSVAPGVALPGRRDPAQLRRVFETGRPAVSDMFPGRIVGRHVVAIDVPVRDVEGRIVYVLTLNPALSGFTDVILRHDVPPSWVVTIFDRNGITVGRSPELERFFAQPAGPTLRPVMDRQREGVLETVSRDGVPRLAAFTHSPVFGWPVVIGVPRSELLAPAVQDALKSLLFGGVSVALSLVLALLVSVRIARPIAALRAVATSRADDGAYARGTGLPETDDVAAALRSDRARRQRSEKRYHALFDANPHMIAVYDLRTMRLLEVNEATVRGYGWSRAELMSMRVPDLCVPEERARLAAMQVERPRDVYNMRHWRKDGTRFDIEAVVRVIEYDGRRAALAMSHDVTDQNLTRSRLAEAIQAFPGSFRLYDREERLVLMNDERWRSLGLNIQIGDTIEKAARAVAAVGADASAIGREEAWVAERLAQFRRADADTEVKTSDGRWHHLIERRTRDGGTISLRRDITARKRIEEQLRQAQKMETFGQLASGVAHDFNNSLAVVMMGLENILDIESADSEAHASAQTALQATQQAASLTRRLLAFSRRQELAPVELDVGIVIGELEKILRSSVSRTIELKVSAVPDCRSVLDRTELETAVMNLVVNARDAIGGTGATTGAIRIAVGHRAITPGDATTSPRLKPGSWIVVSVSDTGSGIPAELIDRIFEPFFTTKEAGKGTGLGLSQIHGFVGQSGGFVMVDSAVGKGTCISLHFPAC
ncbi:MAG: ATP-binding protein [Reyranellaceae bacterium]